MATAAYPNAQFTLLERAKLTEDGKRILPVLEVMNQRGTMDFLRDVPYFPANRGLTHTHRRTTSRPNPTRRRFYEGVTPVTVTTEVINEPLFLFEARTEVDEDEVDTVDNGNEIRRGQDQSASGGCVDSFVNAIFNDDRSSGAQYINGLKSRMTTVSYPGHTTTTLPFVWDNGGNSSTLTSMYMIEWGMESAFAIYPGGGSMAGTILGVIMRNKGREKCYQSASSLAVYYAYVTQIKKWCGLVVRNDWKVARIANIETSTTGSGRFDEDILIRALRHGKFNPATTRLYCNPYLAADIDIRAKDKGNVLWSTQEVFGREVSTFRGIPIRVVDESIITASETQLS
jgi:hypothetical protein